MTIKVVYSQKLAPIHLLRSKADGMCVIHINTSLKVLSPTSPRLAGKLQSMLFTLLTINSILNQLPHSDLQSSIHTLGHP